MFRLILFPLHHPFPIKICLRLKNVPLIPKFPHKQSQTPFLACCLYRCCYWRRYCRSSRFKWFFQVLKGKRCLPIQKTHKIMTLRCMLNNGVISYVRNGRETRNKILTIELLLYFFFPLYFFFFPTLCSNPSPNDRSSSWATAL
jgi:hypothetical protein